MIYSSYYTLWGMKIQEEGVPVRKVITDYFFKVSCKSIPNALELPFCIESAL